MTVQIQFIEGIKETTLPIIKLTRSRNGKTGTSTFIFINPIVFETNEYKKQYISGMRLLWDNKSIVTNDVQIIFKNGKPILIKTILIFKNSKEWFHFLNFMQSYSKDSGLFFSEINS